MKNNGENVRRGKNGALVFSYLNPSSHGFYVSLFVRGGSMHEDFSECGIAHFFEHTAIRNVNKSFGGELYALLDEYGIEFNATTYSEMTQFYLSGAKKNFRFAADVLMRVFLPIALSADEICAERGRIKAEIRESDERTSLLSFTNEIVHEGTSLSRPITGTLKSVRNITKSRLEAYRKRILTPENVFFYVTGNVSDEDLSYLFNLVEALPRGEGKINSNLAPVSRNFFKRIPKIYVKNADFTAARFTFDLDMTSLSLAETDLLYDVLLSGYNSKLFIELSEKRGLFYDVTGSLERYSNIGTLSFSFEVREAVLYEATERIVEILKELAHTPLPENRCMRAPYVDNAQLLLDSPSELAFTFAYDNHIMGMQYSDVDSRMCEYASVSPERIALAAQRIFRLENLTFTVKGNKKKIDTSRLLEVLSNL